jgi:hypothetical protein
MPSNDVRLCLCGEQEQMMMRTHPCDGRPDLRDPAGVHLGLHPHHFCVLGAFLQIYATLVIHW